MLDSPNAAAPDQKVKEGGALEPVSLVGGPIFVGRKAAVWGGCSVLKPVPLFAPMSGKMKLPLLDYCGVFTAGLDDLGHLEELSSLGPWPAAINFNQDIPLLNLGEGLDLSLVVNQLLIHSASPFSRIKRFFNSERA